MDTVKDTALFWLDAGIATVPLVHRSKKPLVAWTPYKVRLPALAEIDMWYRQERNIAIVSGWMNLAILDFDNPEAYSAWYCWQLEFNPDIVDTYRVMSNRGIHVYYYLREPMRLNTIQSALFECKSSGQLCTIPPSIHESGKPYTSLDNPENIRTVKPDEILNYSPIAFQPLVYPTLKASKYAPTSVSNTEKQSDVISQIKSQIKIKSFFHVFDVLDNEGRFYKTHCPIHGRKNNFWIDTKTNMGGCYAGCGTFDVIGLLAKMQNISMSEAVNILRRML